MKLTSKELMNNYDWDKVCEVLKLNPYCINEGLATGDEERKVTDEDFVKNIATALICLLLMIPVFLGCVVNMLFFRGRL